MNRDFVEMLAALSEAEADFMVVGAHDVAAYARPRATGDLERVWRALTAFGAPLDELTRTDLTSDDLIRNKRAVGRKRDLADVADLEGTE